MSAVYIVEDGDHLSAIAERFGFQNALTIWSDPSNAALRALRDSRDMLLAGDEVHIPEREAKTISKPSGASHNIVVRAQRLDLRITLQDVLGAPRGNLPTTFGISGKSIDRTTDADGKVDTPVPRGVADARMEEDERVLAPMVRLTAIEEFEADNDLDVTGEMTGATLAKLVEVHGS